MNEDETERPPYSDELLADLHAGAVDDDRAARLWPLVRADPEAAAYLARLDAVRSRLSGLRDAPPSESIPSAVAARIDTALALQHRPGRGRWFTAAGVGVAAAAAVVLVIALRGTAFGSDAPDSVPLAAPSPEEHSSLFAPETVRSAIGHTAPGPLAHDGRMRECLSANGFDESMQNLGSRGVRYRDRDAVLILLGGGGTPALTALVVGTDCAASNPATLVRHVIG